MPAAGPRMLAVCAVDEPGGAERHLLRLAAGLAAEGWQITVTSPAGGSVRLLAERDGHGWSALPLGGLERGAGWRAIGSWPEARRLAGVHDVVYLNGGVCGRLLPGLIGGTRRTVLHVHDMVTRVPRFWRQADVVLADSEAVAERLAGLPAEVVYGPVDPDPPHLPPPWHPDERPVIGFVGRIEPRKGALDLVRAAPGIRREIPEARVVLVGDDPYGSDPAYTRQVRQATDVEHVPWQPEAASLMRHLDVLVLPSREEPFGTVLAEAMIVGTPVVATQVDGLPEVVRDGLTGRLVAPGDVAALARAVVEVLADRERMSEAASEHAQRFAAPEYVERVAALIRPTAGQPAA